MTSPTFKDHFSNGSSNYATYRPTYPIELVNELANISPNQNIALDCGCGTGQLSVLLANRFKTVIATDASATQIEKAKPCQGVNYKVALAEESGLPDKSTDLITVAQAAHWLNLEKFYNEARRIARPNAAIALITYGILHLEQPVEPIIQDFYYNVIGPYWPKERRHVEEGYKNLPFPFRECQFPELAIEVSWNLQQLLGYINTWSAVKEAEKVLGSKLMLDFGKTLSQAWGDSSLQRKISWPLSLRVGHI